MLRHCDRSALPCAGRGMWREEGPWPGSERQRRWFWRALAGAASEKAHLPVASAAWYARAVSVRVPANKVCAWRHPCGTVLVAARPRESRRSCSCALRVCKARRHRHVWQLRARVCAGRIIARRWHARPESTIPPRCARTRSAESTQSLSPSCNCANTVRFAAIQSPSPEQAAVENSGGSSPRMSPSFVGVEGIGGASAATSEGAVLGPSSRATRATGAASCPGSSPATRCGTSSPADAAVSHVVATCTHLAAAAGAGAASRADADAAASAVREASARFSRLCFTVASSCALRCASSSSSSLPPSNRSSSARSSSRALCPSAHSNHVWPAGSRVNTFFSVLQACRQE